MSRFNISQGFTLVEMIVALVLIALLLVMAVPRITLQVSNGRLITQTQQIHGALLTARAEAIRQSRPVMVCGSEDLLHCSKDNWSQGWIIFVDDANETTALAGEILQLFHSQPAIEATGPEIIRFLPSGFLDLNQEPVAITLKQPNCRRPDGRRINVYPGGRAEINVLDCS